MSDYFRTLEDQLGRATEAGLHNRRGPAGGWPNLSDRRPRLTGRRTHLSAIVLFAGVSTVLVVVVVAIVLGTRGGHPVSAGQPSGQGADSRTGTNRTRASAWAKGTRGAQQTSPGATLPSCVNSTTRKTVPCSPRTPPAPTANGFVLPLTPQPGSPVKLVAQLNLSAPSGARRPAGIARVVAKGAAFGITILGIGLRANSKRDAYAVWLTAGPRSPRLLGFVNPPITRNGKLKTAGALPRHAFRYHRLVITLETRHNPATPGTVILDAPLHT